jgi:hypothetical protein
LERERQSRREEGQMTTKKTTATGKGRGNELKLKKETLQDLAAKG